MESFNDETTPTVHNKRVYSLIDVHSHAYGYTNEELLDIRKEGIKIISVSEDIESSLKNIELYEQHGWLKPCVGIHPWNVTKLGTIVIRELEKIVSHKEIICIGEIGLDTKFVPHSIDRQREFFIAQVKISKEYGLPLNIHSAGTWKEVYELIIKMDIDRAVFHWYTGPHDLLEQIEKQGFYISINPSLKLQEKHRKIAELANINNILLESDGPYNYRGLRLNSKMIKKTIEYLSSLKNKEESYIAEKIYLNTINVFPGIVK